MATEILQPVDPTGSQELIIETINRNFLSLAQRIKSLNEQYSYWDMMRIAEIFTSDINPEEYPTPENPDQDAGRQAIYQAFISTTWARLANYSGAYIRLTAPNASFILDTHEVRNGDYVIKLPGSEFLYIEGPKADIYYPHIDDVDPFHIIYNTSDEDVATSFTVPTVVAANLFATTTVVAPQATLPVATEHLRDVRWYYNGEEVVWGGSFSANQNITNMTLTATYLYVDNN